MDSLERERREMKVQRQHDLDVLQARMDRELIVANERCRLCCSVLQCDAVRCSVLQRQHDLDVSQARMDCELIVANERCLLCCSVLRCVAVCCGMLQCAAVCCSVL